MSKLEDEFILVCGKAGGAFHYEDDTNISTCWMGDVEKYDDSEISAYMIDDDSRLPFLIKLEKNDATIYSKGALEIKNVDSVTFDGSKKSMVLKNNSTSIYVGRYNRLGGIIN